MELDIAPEIEKDIAQIVELFVNDGWNQEDIDYITKNIGISTNPDSRNDKWKTSIGLVLFAKLLTYHDKKRGKWVTEPWICCRTSIEADHSVKYHGDSDRLRSVADQLIKIVKQMDGISMFHDEDAYMGFFDRPTYSENTDMVTISFYVNPSYPDGYWANHTLS